MSEDEHRVAKNDEADDTEAHARQVYGNTEAGDEAEGDEVEAHGRMYGTDDSRRSG